MVTFRAQLLRPAQEQGWTFLRLPVEASNQFKSRGMVSVEGTINETPFQATLQPDGEGGHWLKVPNELQQRAGIGAGEMISLAIAQTANEPEPEVPADFASALAAASQKARQVWDDITPAARRDWIFWMTSGKKVETRSLRIMKACDMLNKGKRRPCCFDRSGMYSKSLSCPVANEEPV